jgi:hypothetical protein
MSQLSKHITIKEFCHSDIAKRKGIDNSIKDPKHLEDAKRLCEKIFEPIREHFGKPIGLSSGYRSLALNKAIPGASKTSQHCKGQAMDIDADILGGLLNKDIFEFIKNNIEFDQMIWEFGTTLNPDWVHVSLKDSGNRKLILRAKRVNGKTVYIPY